jgi:aldehyde:ferredoxin oxidoreductase
MDSTGMCIFVAFPILDLQEAFPALTDMLSARFGVEIDPGGFIEMGKAVLKLEHAFNLAAGFSNADDRLPEFFEYDPLPPHNVVWDFTTEEIDAFWDF